MTATDFHIESNKFKKNWLECYSYALITQLYENNLSIRQAKQTSLGKRHFVSTTETKWGVIERAKSYIWK